jgi:hypothetical protein
MPDFDSSKVFMARVGKGKPLAGISLSSLEYPLS